MKTLGSSYHSLTTLCFYTTDTNLRPFSWLESWHHVFDALGKREVEWYAVITYEALVEHFDVVMQEIMEVIVSGVRRFSDVKTSSQMESLLRQSSYFNSTRKDGQIGRRRLHLHDTTHSGSSYLRLTIDVVERWQACLDDPSCLAVLDGLSTQILPYFGYNSSADIPESVTVNREYGHVLFSSEDAAFEAMGNHPPPQLTSTMETLMNLFKLVSAKQTGNHKDVTKAASSNDVVEGKANY